VAVTKIVVITQARTGSTRLPNKVLMEINGKPLLSIHLERILKSKMIDELIVATTVEEKDETIVNICNKMQVQYYRGSVNNVLDRFYQAAIKEKPTHVVRLTSDCPLIDPILLDQVIDFAIKRDLDYCSNVLIEDFPDGQDIEVMKFSALEYAWKNADKDYEKEHVTPYIREHSTFLGGNLFTSDNFPCPGQYGSIRLTVDEQKDFEVISILANKLGEEKSWFEYADYYQNNNEINELNSNTKRNEGYRKTEY
jgi:spore coat polysaccharide biosynthesis protein SpsF (cytidylyltransferase family)